MAGHRPTLAWLAAWDQHEAWLIPLTMMVGCVTIVLLMEPCVP